jgi:hypothetical protein
MPRRVRSCALIVEGDGDRQAVPLLLRNYLAHIEDFAFQIGTNPIRAGNIRKLLSPGKLEQFVPHAMNRQNSDAVLIVLDADQHCPLDLLRQSHDRLHHIAAARQKPVGLCFLKSEYETLFLFSLASIRAGYKPHAWHPDPPALPEDLESVRGAKERLKAQMQAGSYGEMRDQAAMTHHLDFAALEASRSFRHLRACLDWLQTFDGAGHPVYPRPPSR